MKVSFCFITLVKSLFSRGFTQCRESVGCAYEGIRFDAGTLLAFEARDEFKQARTMHRSARSQFVALAIRGHFTKGGEAGR